MPGKKRWKPAALFLGSILVASAAASRGQDSSVRVWEEPLAIPTYRVGEPERNPIFYSGRAYQGAQGRVYPYVMLDQLTDIRENQMYKAVYLENRYIKICVLPEIGGRIFSALDKTNGYDFFYRQHVIKPALIGMLGAWISGGVEWNIPHHHRATTFMPVDHTVEEHADGSKTIWVGEIELRHRMKWLIGLTLHPDRSFIEATGKLINRTPFAHSFLYFANVAVHANENYQVIFPPDVAYATFHGKNEFLPWPISSRDFRGLEFGREVDVSWWKNHPSPTSWFAWNCEADFFGGYDHGKQAGVVHVADHHVVPGKKFWEFANGPVGRMWDRILTETDGPYIELMAGAYSDNQPDYSWIQPYEVKTWKQYWYPIREIGGMKNANLHAVLNLEVSPQGKVLVGLNATSGLADARVRLAAKDRTLFEESIVISPERPFTKELTLPSGVTEEDLTLALFSAAGEELIAYRPVRYERLPAPETVKPPPAPMDIKTVEELYLTGLRLEQFHNPALEPHPYYEEALQRDPGNSRVNTALAIGYLKRGMFKKAKQHLQAAIRRLTRDYTRPKDGEAFYYLGVALSAQGKDDAATDAFNRAAWSQAWTGAAHYQLARLAVGRNEYAKALEHLERSIAANSLNPVVLNLKAAVLRKLGRFDEAEYLTEGILAADPLDFLAGNELYMARLAEGKSDAAEAARQALIVKMRGEVQSYLEIATDYANWGQWEEATDVLARFASTTPAPDTMHPMVYYYLGYFAGRCGKTEEASRNYQLAASARPEYCFPFRLESVEVLQHAIQQNPRDARARYYLGNLLYDLQPKNAIRAWEESRALDASFATVHRNLGLAYARAENDLPKAMASMEKALEVDRNDPRLYFEFDRLAERAGSSPEKRLARLESHRDVVLERDDATSQLAALYVQLGQYDKALELLNRRHFHTWEGGGEIHNVYINAHLLRGQQHLKVKGYRKALEDFEAALEYPENLEVARPWEGGREAEIHYFIGTAHEALGDRAKATAAFEESASKRQKVPELRYYQGLSYGKLGRDEEARRIFAALIELGRRQIDAHSTSDYFTKFGEQQSPGVRIARAHYLMGLGFLGQGHRAEAQAEFQAATDNDVNHIWARAQLAALQ